MDAATRYARHIAALCLENGIEVSAHSRGGRAFRRKRLIKIRPVATAITYAVALHEIGHILGPRQSGLRLDKEAGAWEWAIANAIDWTPVMQRKMEACLCSYIRASKRGGKLKPAALSHPVYALARCPA
jgi:hypothetical protein